MSDLKNIPKDAPSFVAIVLWLHGGSVREIARVVKWRPGQLRGFVQRLLTTQRAHLSIGERAALLDELKGERHDGGRLREEHFKPIPLDGGVRELSRVEQVARLELEYGNALLDAKEDPDPHERRKEAEKVHARFKPKLEALEVTPPDPTTRAGRAGIRRLERSATRKKELAARAKEKRELGAATRRGISASALDWLLETRRLRDPGQANSKTKGSEEQRRHECGTRFRGYIEGARLGPLAALDYERATMGGRGGPKGSLATHKLYCTHALGTLRQLLTQADYAFLEAVIDQDLFIWENEVARSAARLEIFEGIRYALDVVAVHESLMTREEFAARWKGEVLPDVARVTRQDAARQAGEAAELLESAR